MPAAIAFQRSGFRFRRGKFGFGTRHVQVIANTAIKTAAHELHLLFAQIDRAVHRGDFRVERANREMEIARLGSQTWTGPGMGIDLGPGAQHPALPITRGGDNS